MLKSVRHTYYALFSWSRRKFGFKKSALVWTEMLSLFVNTLTADDKCCCGNMQSLPQQFETPLPQKEKNFLQLFIAFVTCAWNLGHFQKKDEYASLIISEIIDSERRGDLNV